MSGITLIEKIKKDAAITVAEIKSAGATEVESIQREIEAEVAELKKNYLVTLEKTKAHMELVAISKAKQSGNIAVQSTKRAHIDAVFNAVMEDLQDQSSDDYATFFKKFVEEIVPKKLEVVRVDAPAHRIKETEKILKDSGFTCEVKASSAIKAGLVIHSKDGIYDVTLVRLMSEKRPELEMIVVNQAMS